MSLIDIAAEEAGKHGAIDVVSIRLKLGPLSGVVKEALLSAFESAREDSPMPGCSLLIQEVPIVGRCTTCKADRPVNSVQKVVCSICGTPIREIISGRELEVVGLEIIDAPANAPANTIGRSPPEGA